jgi:hypothetical protein
VAGIHGLTGTVAYVECRSRPRGNYLDINYHLRVRDGGGQGVQYGAEGWASTSGWVMQDLPPLQAALTAAIVVS